MHSLLHEDVCGSARKYALLLKRLFRVCNNVHLNLALQAALKVANATSSLISCLYWSLLPPIVGLTSVPTLPCHIPHSLPSHPPLKPILCLLLTELAY